MILKLHKRIRNILEDAWWEVSIWYKVKIRDKIYDIKYGIKNIFKWIPIIWTDRDWDYRYLYEVLHFKLKDMERSLLEDEWHIHSDKYAKQVMIAKNLTKRLIDDNYYDVAQKIYSIKPNSFNLKMDDNEQDKYAKCFKYEKYMREQDKNYLFKYMNKHIENWWN